MFTNINKRIIFKKCISLHSHNKIATPCVNNMAKYKKLHYFFVVPQKTIKQEKKENKRENKQKNEQMKEQENENT